MPGLGSLGRKTLGKVKARRAIAVVAVPAKPAEEAKPVEPQEDEESSDEDIPFFEDMPNPRIVKEREEQAKHEAAEEEQQRAEAAVEAAHQAKLDEIEARAKAIERMPEGPAKESAEARCAEEAAKEDAAEMARHPPPPQPQVAVVHEIDIQAQKMKKTVGAPGSRPYGDGYEGTGARPCSHYNGDSIHCAGTGTATVQCHITCFAVSFFAGARWQADQKRQKVRPCRSPLRCALCLLAPTLTPTPHRLSFIGNPRPETRQDRPSQRGRGTPKTFSPADRCPRLEEA